jgi:hypothetical protein
MPEANQIVFDNKELLELLLKKADVHEGKWILQIMFGFGPGNFGPTPDQMTPGVVVAVQKIGIQRATDETPVEMTIDAAVVNPPPEK